MRLEKRLKLVKQEEDQKYPQKSLGKSVSGKRPC